MAWFKLKQPFAAFTEGTKGEEFGSSNDRLRMPDTIIPYEDEIEFIGSDLLSDQQMIGTDFLSDQKMIGTVSVFTREAQIRMFACMTSAQIATLERLVRNAIEAEEKRAAVMVDFAHHGLEMGR